MRDIPFIVFEAFIALITAYVAGRIVLATGLDIEWAGAAAALGFAVTILVIDHPSSK
jgi:hypothetical protein